MDTKGIGTVGTLLFLGIFAGLSGFGPAFEHNVAVQEYEPTTATIQSTDIDVRTDSDGDEHYNPVIEYEYTVDGEQYEQDNTFPGRFTRDRQSESWAQDIVDQYEPGEEVTVYYDPSAPQNAYLRNDGLPGGWFVAVGFVPVAIAGGVYLIRKGFRRWRQRQLIKNTPTEHARSVSIGPSELTGTVAMDGRDPLPAPFSDEDCVVASYEVKEYDDGDDGGWETVSSDTVHVPFSIDDGTGRVLVKPHDDAVFDLDPDDWTETYVDSSERGPGPIRKFVTEAPDLDFPSDASGRDNDRKYRQNLIRPNESVYVFGTVHSRDESEFGSSNAEQLVVKKTDEGSVLSEPMYMISDDSAKNLTARRRWALWRAPVGGFFLVVAVVYFLGTVGPMFGIQLPVLV